jgi:hypothetical protein
VKTRSNSSRPATIRDARFACLVAESLLATEPHEPHVADRFLLPELVQHLLGDRRRFVDRHDAHRAVAVAAQCKLRDIDLMLTEHCAYCANDARLIGVAGHDHRALEVRFHGDAVDKHEARRCVFEHCALDPTFTLAAAEPH